MLIDEHVHNTYLYTFLSAGFVGAVAFAGGLIYAWLIFFYGCSRKGLPKNMIKKPFSFKLEESSRFLRQEYTGGERRHVRHRPYADAACTRVLDRFK